MDAYTPDAKIFPNGMDILQGSDAIRRYWTPPAERQSRTIYHHIMPEEIKILGDEAYDWGYYEGKTSNADGSETPWKGTFGEKRCP
jgi:ketosteroid isomerase-like protein